jgi:hypothetical protein
VCRRSAWGVSAWRLTAPVGRGSVRAGASRLAAVYDENPKKCLGSCDRFTADERATLLA